MKRIIAALFIAVLLVVSGIAIYSSRTPSISPSSNAYAQSYNPPPLNHFKAPLSTMAQVSLIKILGGQDVGFGAQVPEVNQQVGSGNFGDPSMSSISTNAVRFIIDNSYIPQSETSIAVDPNNPNRIVGGFNDARFFFCPFLPSSDCPSGFTISVTGFTTSSDGGSTVSKSNDLPGISAIEKNLTSGQNVPGFLISWGDPSVVAGPNHRFYFGSLAIDPVTGANGIMVAVSTSALFGSNNPCLTPINNPSVNPCWKTKLVFGNLSFQCQGGSCYTASFEDKELLAVDNNPSSSYYGSVYVAWDHFNSDGTSNAYLARCDSDLSNCVMLSGGGKPLLSGSDSFVAFTTPAIDSKGGVHVAYCNYGTVFTLGPIVCKSTSSPAGGNNFAPATKIVSFEGAGTDFPDYNGLLGFATEQFRTFSIPSIATDTSGKTNNVYFVIDVCTSGNYYGFQSPLLPGNCGSSAILFSKSGDGGNTWSNVKVISSTGVNVQPYVTVDRSTGNIFVVYYTTQFDRFNHRIDVVAKLSSNGGGSFSQIRVTYVSNEPNADPSDFNYIAAFGGSFVVPQYGDYFQAVAYKGTLYVLYTGNYAAELGTFQTDPFLTVLQVGNND